MQHDDKYFMELALKEAEAALDEGEIPVGAIVVCNGKVVAKARNQTERLNDSTAHAEMIALTAAMHALGAKYLTECTLYVTLEPCQMCAGALYWAKLKKVVYGASDLQRGYEHLGCPLHPKTVVIRGILKEQSEKLMKRFFEKVRK
jgi:tRNA(adenine34) deaminase